MKFCNSLLIASMAATASAFAPSSLSSSSGSGLKMSFTNYDPNGGAGGPPPPPSLAPEGSFAPASKSPIDDDFLRKAPTARKVQGDTLKTWDFANPNTQRVQVGAKGSNGRPLHSRIEYWHTPSYIPFQVTAYTEDGLERPIDCIIETPKHPKTIALFNTASQQMPFDAAVDDTGLVSPYDAVANAPGAHSDIVQGGGMVKYYTFDADVESVQVYIRSPEYNMKAKIELTTGPDSVRQTYEVYCSSGYKTPFYCVIQTPGSQSSTLRLINQNSVEFPFDAYVLPYQVGDAGMGDGADDFGSLGWGETRGNDRPASSIMGSW